MDASQRNFIPKYGIFAKNKVLPSERSRYQRVVYSKPKEDLTSPVIPLDESSEKAGLRREMVEHGLSKVGAIVAELNIDEGVDGETSEDEDDLRLIDVEEDKEEDEEDRYGRSTRRVVDDRYARDMRALQKKLEGDGGQMNSRRGKEVSSGNASRLKEKSDDRPSHRSPLSDVIIEHSPPQSSSSSSPNYHDVILPVSDELNDDSGTIIDPLIHRQEIAMEYHKSHNRMIHRQGGFLRDDGDDDGTDEGKMRVVPLSREEGGPKRVSRFKAARLRP